MPNTDPGHSASIFAAIRGIQVALGATV
ncbi:hypothetical protein EYZ11_013525 [Aspergillus tanneri]|uniref:Uncharacterized protein n=1 Tax=Aspergillus tanneri TaxID=1220188 RepID=A0A4S3IXG1_9EURO|nr:hypothetical protein EYZ11_013525 [Aspergillus tanneri]